MYVSLDDDYRVKSRLNPERYGGVGWREFINTNKGDKMMALLNESFPIGSLNWFYVSDTGILLDHLKVCVDVGDASEIYRAASELADLGCSGLFQEMVTPMFACFVNYAITHP